MPNSLSYLTHKNGRGKLFDVSEACKQSYVDRDSVIRDDSSIWRSKIVASQVVESTISNAVIDSSTIKYSVITGGRIESSFVAAEYIGQNVHIKASVVTGKFRAAHSASIVNCRLKNATVTGNAKLLNWADSYYQTDPLTGDAMPIDFFGGYISRGVWHRPPRIFRVSPLITVTESIAGYAFVHCREYSITKWLKIGNRIGKAAGWSHEEVLAVRKAMHSLLNS